MYELKNLSPGYSIYNTAGEFICRLNCIENAMLVKMVLNYDMYFESACLNLKDCMKDGKISFEKMVDNNL